MAVSAGCIYNTGGIWLACRLVCGWMVDGAFVYAGDEREDP